MSPSFNPPPQPFPCRPNLHPPRPLLSPPSPSLLIFAPLSFLSFPPSLSTPPYLTPLPASLPRPSSPTFSHPLPSPRTNTPSPQRPSILAPKKGARAIAPKRKVLRDAQRVTKVCGFLCVGVVGWVAHLSWPKERGGYGCLSCGFFLFPFLFLSL